ncbi:sensor domain-containing diguanylate cyclase [Reinekea marinisedimentorum]|uniref:Diguanylate cyclase (GGDEF)-like protein n=1 Tax=Reinekea marinisedimentorum TaxID=230495 RepID=A0A4R3ID67_9GAMM|nr:sensor domain-containing diguanylate cyclase [Reinekea marinisedimentorum]TCS43667.1 diguanylate cyclase (GGDEF)-like protein [Reinekea marinisedimentorum]
MKLSTRIKQFYLLVMIVSVFAIMGLSVFAFFQVSKNQQVLIVESVDAALDAEVRQKVSILMDSMASSLFNPIYNYDFNEMEIILKSVARNREVSNVFIFDNDSRLLVNLNQTVEDEVALLQLIKTTPLQMISSLPFGDDLLFVHPVASQSVQLGYVVAIVSLDSKQVVESKIASQFEDMSNDFITQLSIILLLAAALVVATSFYYNYAITRYLLKPLQYLATRAHQVGLQNYDEKIKLLADEELVDLAQSLDTMRAMLRTSNSRQRRLAYFDKVTELPNRHKFHNDVERLIEEGEPFCILFCDLDDFKAVNDTKGHSIGDELLSAFGNRAIGRLSLTGANDFRLYRVGGDEFVLTLRNVITQEDVIKVANTLVEATAQPFRVQQALCEIGVSVGGACFPEHGSNLETLLIHADLAMYAAKHKGKNQVQMYGEE